MSGSGTIISALFSNLKNIINGKNSKNMRGFIRICLYAPDLTAGPTSQEGSPLVRGVRFSARCIQWEMIKALEPDILVVVAYGRILPDDILAVPKYGAINVHGSLLPKYRGAAPIQWSVLNGDKVTGVTTMYLAHDMDAGDVIYKAETEIGEYETAGELFDRLMDMGAELLIKTLDDIENGTAPRTPQDHSQATYVGMLDKSICPIDWNNTPRMVLKHIYGLQPWPVATMELDGAVYRVFGADYTHNKCSAEPGTVVGAGKNGIEIACADGETLLITELQAPGKKRMKAADFLRGHNIKVKG